MSEDSQSSRGQLASVVIAIVLVAVVIAALLVTSHGHHTAPGRATGRASTGATTGSTASSSPARSAALIPLRIAPASHAASYDRAEEFGGFVDVDGCKNARAELLIRTSAVPTTFTRPSACTVKSGRWTDPWSGVTTTLARDLQIDHTVPLANAWRSGAWAWTRAQLVAFANDLADPGHLVPILGRENEAKGDDGPELWKPPRHAAWCAYARTWDRIKAKWNLSATQSEWNALVAMAATC